MEQLDLTDVTQFIEDRDLVPEKCRRYYLHWIRRFLMEPRASNPALSGSVTENTGTVASAALFIPY